MGFLDKLMRETNGQRGAMGYFTHYEYYFDNIRLNVKNVLEIGVWESAKGLRVWKKYFPNAQIWGLDNNPDYKQYEEDRIKIFIGDQSSVSSLEEFKNFSNVEFDIIIDDGGHETKMQQTSLSYLFPILKNGGFYVIEDLHTSYIPHYFSNRTINGIEKVREDETPENTTVNMLTNIAKVMNCSSINIKNKHNIDIQMPAFISFHQQIVFIKKRD